MPANTSVIFQSAKLGDMPWILDEFAWAEKNLAEAEDPPGRIYGNSGGSLVALAFALALAARLEPIRWGKAYNALDDFVRFLQGAGWRDLRGLNWNPWYGVYHLKPLRAWLVKILAEYDLPANLRLSAFPVALYLCAGDQDGLPTFFGKNDESLQFQYQFMRVGPPQDAIMVDALIAALSTSLSTEPGRVNGAWYRDSRPAAADIGAIVADLEAADPHPLLRRRPFARLRSWTPNFLTTSFIMHSYVERNQTLLAAYYLDLLKRRNALETGPAKGKKNKPTGGGPLLTHVQLPYVGSTEAATNMRDSVAQKTELMEKFTELLDGQLDHTPFDQPTNIIYGAGGFSGILAGLVTTRAIETGFGGDYTHIRQIYGVSAGVLNGFFHAVQVAAAQHPEFYTPAAGNALGDLENFIAGINRKKFLRYNKDPRRLWLGWGNLEPLGEFLSERLQAYTGVENVQELTFDDIRLPLTVAVARFDGFTDFLGMTAPERSMHFAWREIAVKPAPVIRALLAGWSMNTYVEPMQINGEFYTDGGGPYYDIGLFAACMDAELINLINIHLDEPEGHSYKIPPRPNLLRLVFDTHNYTFPESRRRMFMLTNLLYEHARRQGEVAGIDPEAGRDFRRTWVVDEVAKE